MRYGRLGIVRPATERFWDGSCQVDHLSVHIDTEAMKVYVSDGKVMKVRRLAKTVLSLAQRNRRLVSPRL